MSIHFRSRRASPVPAKVPGWSLYGREPGWATVGVKLLSCGLIQGYVLGLTARNAGGIRVDRLARRGAWLLG